MNDISSNRNDFFSCLEKAHISCANRQTHYQCAEKSKINATDAAAATAAPGINIIVIKLVIPQWIWL